MILCHTPLRNLKHDYKEKFILVSGIGNIIDICKDYGFNNAIHVDEVFSMCPDIVPLSKASFPIER